jgi:hypothetical protein
MPYVYISDFRGGLDKRRMDLTSVPGTLVQLTNAHITRGGEIEKRPAFVSLATLPSNTTGLAAAGGQIYVFGSVAAGSVTFPSGTPSNINYKQLVHPSGTALTSVLDVTFYNGRVYAIAQFADGRIYHYYEDTSNVMQRITDWFDGRARATIKITGGTLGGTSATGSFAVTAGSSFSSDSIRAIYVNNVQVNGTTVAHTGNNSTTATAIANNINGYTSVPNYTAAASGAVVTITAVTVGVGSNGYAVSGAVEGTANIGSLTAFSGGLDNAITNITVDGVSIIQNQVKWQTSHAYTASLLEAEINTFRSSPEYEATAVGEYVNIISKASGASFNTKAVVVTKTGNVTTVFDPTSATSLNGGADSSTVNGYTPGKFVRPVKSKMYSLMDSLLHFSGTNDPTEWTDANTGAGFINLSNNAIGSEDLRAVASYYDNVAIFAEQAIQIWFLDANASLNAQMQVLNNTGTFAPKSVVEFGENDVFYLAESGIRSLKARDSSNAAYASDIGNPIDDIVTPEIRADFETAKRAVAILEPKDGRYMIAIGEKVYVFSYFPNSSVSAWSVYEPGFAIDNWAYDGKQVLCRSGNTIYSFGGTAFNTYDNSTVTIQLPFLDAGTPATGKDFVGIDVTCENEWIVSSATDPTDLTTTEEIATISRSTYGLGRVSMVGYSTHIAPKLVCSTSGSAKIGTIVIHYEGGEAS